MAAKMTLEVFEKQLLNFKKEDVQKKMDIASNVYKQCSLNLNTTNDKNASLLSKCHELTGVATETLVAVQSLESKSIKFEEWLKERKEMLQRYSYEYNSARKLLLRQYTQLLEIPTDIKEEKEFSGYKKYFTSVQLPGTNASIMVEKPETVMERHRFLHTKMIYTEQKKNIVYIGKVNLLLNFGKFIYKEDNVNGKNQYYIAASQKYGLLSHRYVYCFHPKEDYMAIWINDKVIPQLSDESVVIFQENIFKNDDPRVSELSRQDIIKWLNLNNVPHDRSMHKAELYKLVKVFQQNRAEKLSQIEVTLRAKGHITIRQKKCNLSTTYYESFWDLLMDKINTAMDMPVIKALMRIHEEIIHKKLDGIVQKLPLEYWVNLGNVLQEKERTIYREDLEMEHIIDKLMTMVKHEGLSKESESLANLDAYDKTTEKEYLVMYDTILKLYEDMNKAQLLRYYRQCSD